MQVSLSRVPARPGGYFGGLRLAHANRDVTFLVSAGRERQPSFAQRAWNRDVRLMATFTLSPNLRTAAELRDPFWHAGAARFAFEGREREPPPAVGSAPSNPAVFERNASMSSNPQSPDFGGTAVGGLLSARAPRLSTTTAPHHSAYEACSDLAPTRDGRPTTRHAVSDVVRCAFMD